VPTILSRSLGRRQPKTLTQVPSSPHASCSPSSSSLVSPPTGFRFLVLDSVPLGHLDQVAMNCSIIFWGERGPRLEQIAAIKAKEIFEGTLAASRAQAECERMIRPKRISFPEHFCYCFSSNLCVLNATNTD
jgi:hypothetical protein